jgi:hypothetical protein
MLQALDYVTDLKHKIPKSEMKYNSQKGILSMEEEDETS